jgi:iron complex transport system ATP-binding protein
MEEKPLIKVSNLVVGYKSRAEGETRVAGPINLKMKTGQLICLLGPNGAGKSTFLKTIAGLQNPLSGDVELEGNRIKHLAPAQLARKLSLVLTDSVKSGNLKVYSLVALGRYPYSGWLGRLNAEDKEIINQAIKSTHIEDFLDRSISHLSDGECQKVMLARALAQDTPLVILDEPTAHLDLPSRIELMRLLHCLAAETNKAILISTHELDLALQVADEIWLLKKDGSMVAGAPEDLVLNGLFEAAFDKAGVLFDKLTGTFNIHQNSGAAVQVIGSGAEAFWTKRALARSGYHTHAEESAISITVNQNLKETVWLLKKDGTTTEARSVKQLIELLNS